MALFTQVAKTSLTIPKESSASSHKSSNRKSLSTQFCIVKRLWYMKFCLVWTAAMSNIAAWIVCAQLVHRCHPVPTPWLQVGTRGTHQTVSSLVYFCHYKVSFLHSGILVKGQQHFPLVWISSLHCESMACSMTFKTGGSPKREGTQWPKNKKVRGRLSSNPNL